VLFVFFVDEIGGVWHPIMPRQSFKKQFFVYLKSIAYELKKYKKPPQTAAVSW
jgi:hypothetical protein